MDPVVHFEMPFEDRERMAKFYRSAFGWQTEMLGAEMDSYVLATTVETGEKGPKRPGAINGGFYPKHTDWPAQYPSIVIAVNDIRKAVAKVAEAGGSVLGEPMEIPGVGSYVSFMDPEGNRVSMLQPIPQEATSFSMVSGKGDAGLSRMPSSVSTAWNSCPGSQW
jgi:predicted enzyme related to lactoylglutathione lyase